ncbi:hypothetical protein J6590_099497 [Homalodisca vitripennis]|nr:hypothetical protein J6590_099497 [Homalodisca vitripennis]
MKESQLLINLILNRIMNLNTTSNTSRQLVFNNLNVEAVATDTNTLRKQYQLIGLLFTESADHVFYFLVPYLGGLNTKCGLSRIRAAKLSRKARTLKVDRHALSRSPQGHPQQSITLSVIKTFTFNI